MKKSLFFLFTLLFVSSLKSQTFTSSTSELNNTYHSGGCTGVTDMDHNGYDDIIILDDAKNLYIEYQDTQGNFTVNHVGLMSLNPQWGMAVGDIDNDGHNDVISGGWYDGLNIAHIIDQNTSAITNNPVYPIFMQGLSLGDINNDGWLDAMGCHDDGEGAIWGNDGLGNLEIQNSWIDMATTPVSDNSGNYGSVFCDIDDDGDLDLYIAKCRQGVSDPNDPRRINALFINDGNNNYTEQAEIRGLAPHKQSWTSDFMDIDNDGDFDCFLTNHGSSLMIFENDGSGFFTDITPTSGLQNAYGFFLQGKFADFDNDGFVDLLYAGGNGASGLFHNNGNNTFSPVANNFNDNGYLHSFGIGDLNHDGNLDFYASYGNGYVSPNPDYEDRIWFNNGGSGNNWITVQLEGTISNASAIGTKVKIYGSWGVQIREVRGGESYGITNSFDAHFGLGNSTSIDSIAVFWPAGGTTTVINPEINQFLPISEPPEGQIVVDLTVFLEGNYVESTGLMNDDLRISGYIPTTEPYTTMGFTQVIGGGETTSTTVLNNSGLEAVVDWIFVELRDPNNSSLILATQSVLLLRNGKIVAVDGISPVIFTQIDIDAVYIVVKHRNHFGIRTAESYPTSSTITLDMSNQAVALQGISPTTIVGDIRLLTAGDANGDGQVNAVDKNNYWRVENGSGYDYYSSPADFNLDGIVNPVDKNDFWRTNNSKIEQID